METDFADYKMRLTLSAGLPIEGEPDTYINKITGETSYYDEEKGSYELCGRLERKWH